MYKIEKNIPVPPVKHPFKRKGKYPWRDLGISVWIENELIGDSFFVPNGAMHVVSAAARMFGKRINMKFLCRAVDGGVRVWRIA